MVEQTSNRPETNVVGLVLAGGLSSRMGTDKSKLRFTHNDISLLHHATQLLHQVGLDTVLISGSEPQHIQDEFKGCGPLGGIHAGFNYIKHNHHRASAMFVLPVDMPNLSSSTLMSLVKAGIQSNEIVHFETWNLPMCIPLHEDIFAYLNNTLDQGAFFSLHSLLRVFNAQSIPLVTGIDCNEFDNINLPAQWEDLNRSFNTKR
ncbi:MAG: molybdenum cofactor guanylyltransferase [Paraglaciecola polaris]|uniref:molybdenum cofactor guanylyltransferase n=1 Tax=Paraglaciecola polaris TaxID=222814 RepID=UPI0030018BD7|tara:strand:- start:12129 stop:12740 length:612 start_codon:yes stop_codon:yes gene_type:complete